MEVNATKEQIKTLKDSIIWTDMIRELEFWKEGFDLEMGSIVDKARDENPSTASVLLHMGDINGRKKAVDYMINLPDVLLSILEDKIDDSRHNATD